MDALLRRRLMMLGGGGPTPPPYYPLPTGAIPCEMIYADGYDAFIDTSLLPMLPCSVETEAIFVKPVNSGDWPLGSYDYNPNRRWNPVAIASAGPYNVGLGTVDAVANYPSNARVAWRKVKASANATGAVLESYDKQGTLIDTQTLSFSVNLADLPGVTIGLIKRKNTSTGDGRGALGRTKIYGDDQFGTLAGDFEPCYYNGNFGFWDHVTGQHLVGNDTTKIYGIGSHWNTEGFFPNAYNTNSTANAQVGYLADWRGYITTRLLTIPQGCAKIRFNAGSVHSGTYYDFISLDGNQTFKHWWGYNAADREITGFSDSTYVRMTMPVGKENDCYIYDVTNGQYIWKGINV